jgi:hypothetical protein
MLEPLVRRGGVDQGSQGQLVDVAQPLERVRIQHLPLIRIEPHENMDRVTYLV